MKKAILLLGGFSILCFTRDEIIERTLGNGKAGAYTEFSILGNAP